MPTGQTERFSAHKETATEVERLCSYLKNDSVVRWYLGCSQAAVDAARKELAKRRDISEPYCSPGSGNFETREEEQRARRAAEGNREYLRAIRAAAR